MPVLNNQQVGNAYPVTPGQGASMANVWNSRGGWFSVTGAGAFVQLQYGDYSQAHWVEEILLGAGAFVVLPPNCRGMQFRNSVANAIATVTAQIAQGDEPPLAISTIGQTNVVSVASLNFQHNELAVATEPTLDFVDSATVTLTVADDVANTRVKVTPAIPASVALPGAPTTTTPATGDSSTLIATTAFVKAQGYVTAATAPVTSVDGRTGAVTGLADLTAAALQTFTGPIAPSFVSTGGASSGALAAGAITVTTGSFRITSTDASTLSVINGRPSNSGWLLEIVNASGSTIPYTTGGGAGLGIASAGSISNSSRLLLWFDPQSVLWIPVAMNDGLAGAAAVASVFTRTGAVVATAGDYTAALVTNAADKASGAQQTFVSAVGSGGASSAVGAAAGTFIGATGIHASAVASTAGRCFSATVTGDTTGFRWQVLGDGSQGWGGGAGAVDTTAGRAAAGLVGLGGATFLTGGKLVEGWSLVSQAGGTWTPTLNLGLSQQLTTSSGAAITVGSPGAPPANQACNLTLYIRNGSGGAIASITWNAIFRSPPATIPTNGIILWTTWTYNRDVAQYTLTGSGTI